MTRITLGDLGEEQTEYEFEPLTTPLSVPEPQTAPEREPVPA